LKINKLLVSFGLLFSLVMGGVNTAFGTSIQTGHGTEKEKVIFEKPEIKDLDKLFKTKFENVEVDGKLFKEEKVKLNSFIKNEKTGSQKTNVSAQKQATQLLKITKKGNDHYTADYVTVAEVNFDSNYEKNGFVTKSSIKKLGVFLTLDTATGATTEQAWAGGVTGYVTVYYHVDKYTGMVDSKDMNYIQVKWTVASGSTIERRSATMYQNGRSHWGSILSSDSKTVYPTGNSMTQYDVPDAWLPLWEGNMGARSKAYVKNGTVTLNVNCSLMSI
jgi:hypothetical protein